METVQDLLTPSNYNILIMEDPKSGDVSVPGATVVEIRDQQSFVDLLRTGEAHRFAANTKLNTESSRSHAILMVRIFQYFCGGPERFLNSIYFSPFLL
jgi:kinesin family protein 5